MYAVIWKRRPLVSSRSKIPWPLTSPSPSPSESLPCIALALQLAAAHAGGSRLSLGVRVPPPAPQIRKSGAGGGLWQVELSMADVLAALGISGGGQDGVGTPLKQMWGGRGGVPLLVN